MQTRVREVMQLGVDDRTGPAIARQSKRDHPVFVECPPLGDVVVRQQLGHDGGLARAAAANIVPRLYRFSSITFLRTAHNRGASVRFLLTISVVDLGAE
jgi:hypothetical protein